MGFPNLVSLVCYHWHAPALTSSRLWSTILLEIGQDDSLSAEILLKSAENRFQHVAKFLERFRQVPLGVVLSYGRSKMNAINTRVMRLGCAPDGTSSSLGLLTFSFAPPGPTSASSIFLANLLRQLSRASPIFHRTPCNFWKP